MLTSVHPTKRNAALRQFVLKFRIATEPDYIRPGVQ